MPFVVGSDVLYVCGCALSANNIGHILLETSKKKFSKILSQFKQDPKLQVLLIPIVSSGKGVNITEATHTVFIEPQIVVSYEQQAVGRMYRLGQREPCYVHRFAIDRTVEQNIHKKFNPNKQERTVNNATNKVSNKNQVYLMVALCSFVLHICFLLYVSLC